MIAPADCHSMQDLRAQIDALDAAIVGQLAVRAAYIDRAAVLKQTEKLPARIEDRVEQVVERVRQQAQAKGLDPALVEELWRRLIDWSIAKEEQVLGPDRP